MRTEADWEPEKNCYILTVVLEDVKKQTALEISQIIKEVVMEEYTESVGELLITAAHVKHNFYSPRPQ